MTTLVELALTAVWNERERFKLLFGGWADRHWLRPRRRALAHIGNLRVRERRRGDRRSCSRKRAALADIAAVRRIWWIIRSALLIWWPVALIKSLARVQAERVFFSSAPAEAGFREALKRPLGFGVLLDQEEKELHVCSRSLTVQFDKLEEAF